MLRDDDREDTWVPTMPGEDDAASPKERPIRELVLRDLEPIDVVGRARDAIKGTAA